MMTNTGARVNHGAQDAGREAAEYYCDTFREPALDLEWLLERFRHDVASRTWTDAAWLVYRDAAQERWGELHAGNVTGETVLDRQRTATLSIPAFEVHDEITGRIPTIPLAEAGERLWRGKRRDSDLPPF